MIRGQRTRAKGDAMTIIRQAAIAALICAGTAAGTGAGAQDAGGQDLGTQTLTLDFAPPQMEVEPVCQARAPDAALAATWAAWDGKTLPDRAPALITRDLRRLAEMDPIRWDATIQAAIPALAAASPKFTPDDVLLARITQMIAMGQMRALTEAGLVQQLLDRADLASSRMQFELSGFLTEGIGIAKDPVRGTELLISAGYGGNADALLSLSAMTVAGNPPAGWDITPDLAVTMAFGSLVGQMDPLICDRIARIAREYASGSIVTVDQDLAMRWYRFAADLGDPISAWRVVEFQMQSELVTKDNAVLMTYLTKAAEGGLPYAMIALGRVFEVGALAPRDIAAARTLYDRAAALGDHAALIRLAGFLEVQMKDDPALRPEFITTLQTLATLPDAPAWVFARQAEMILQDQGRWQGQAAARPLWEQAAERRDPGAIRALALADLGLARTDAAFYAAVDPLIQMVSSLGEVAPATDVKEAFLCKSPHAPQVEQAAFWAGVETSIGSSSLDFTPQLMADLTARADPLAMAELQTQALSGRASSLANMMALLQERGVPPETLAFWADYASRVPGVTNASAALDLSRARTPAQRDRALELFATAMDQGDTSAALNLAAALLEDPDMANRTRALALLEPLAAMGQGGAMALLQIADPARFPNPQAVYLEFASAIAAQGDFAALVLAMPFLQDAALRETYRARATEVMDCSFPEAIAFARVWGGLGQLDEARRWLAVAAELAGQDAWQMVVLGDAQREQLGDAGLASAVVLYEKSNALGSKTAVQRLLKLYGVRGEPGYDATRAADLFVTMVERSDPTAIPELLAELTRRNPALAVTVDTRLDLDLLYQQAAEAGNPSAMREHARRLREAAEGADQIAAATGWLVKASEAGDAKAMVLLSQAYSLGVGIAPSLDLAQSWLQRAADAGDPTALDLVKLLQAQGVTN